MRVNNLVRYVALTFLALSANVHAWNKVSTDNSLYSDELGSRVSIYEKNGRYVYSTGSGSTTGSSGGVNNLSLAEDDFVTYGSAQAAFDAAQKDGFCAGGINKTTMSCYTGNQGQGSNSGSGTSSNNSGSSSQSGNSSGTGTNNGSGSDNGSVLPPNLPVPSIDTPNIDSKEVQALRERYKSAFNGLKEWEVRAKKVLAESLDVCVLFYGGTTEHNVCADRARKSFQKELDKIREAFEILQQNMSKDFIELLKSAGVSTPSIPNVNISQPSNDAGMATGGTGTEVNITNNNSTTTEITNIDNSSSTNINNNVSGGRGGSGGGTTNVTVNTKDYSGFLGSILGSLNDIKNKIAVLGSGSSSNIFGDTDGSAANSAETSDKNGEECKENDGTLRCSTLGAADDVKLPEKMDFGIKKETVDVSKYFNWRRIVGGNENCPAPIKISTSLFTKEIPLQPLCDFAKMIRGAVILLFAMWGMRIALKGES